MRKIGPQLEEIRKLIVLLEKTSKKTGHAIWKRVAEYLKGPRSNRAEINVGNIARLTKAGEVIVVPGKVLGDGEITHAVSVAALRFSRSAYDKITRAGGKCLSIEQLVKENPSGSGVRIIV